LRADLVDLLYLANALLLSSPGEAEAAEHALAPILAVPSALLHLTGDTRALQTLVLMARRLSRMQGSLSSASLCDFLIMEEVWSDCYLNLASSDSTQGPRRKIKKRKFKNGPRFLRELSPQVWRQLQKDDSFDAREGKDA